MPITTHVVSSITAMISLSPNNDDVIIVTDANRGGTFYYDTTSSLTENEGTIFESSVNAGEYFVRVFDGDINLRWFGAEGDDTTDDRESIQKAIKFCSSNSKTLYIPKGNYVIKSEGIFIYGNMNIRGDGAESVLKLGQPTAPNDYSIMFGLNTESTPAIEIWSGVFERLKIEKTSSTTEPLINLFQVEDFILRDLEINNFKREAIVAEDYSAYTETIRRNGLLSNLTIVGDSTNSTIGISISDLSSSSYTAENFVIEDCKISNLSDEAIGIHGACQNISIVSNFCESTGAIIINNANNVLIDSNVVQFTDDTAYISVGYDTGNTSIPKNIIISNNSLEMPDSGSTTSELIMADGVEFLTITNNQIINNLSTLVSGIKLIDNTSFSISSVVIEGNMLNNATIINNGTNNDGIVITNNRINGGYIETASNGTIGINSIIHHSSKNVLYYSEISQVRPDVIVEFKGTINKSSSSEQSLYRIGNIYDWVNLQKCQILGYDIRVEDTLGIPLTVMIRTTPSGGTSTTYSSTLGSSDNKDLFSISTTSQIINDISTSFEALVQHNGSASVDRAATMTLYLAYESD